MPQQIVTMIENSPILDRIKERAKELGISLPEEAERRWKKAKTAAERQYDVGEDKPGFYPIVMGIYKKMIGLSHEKDFAPGEISRHVRVRIKI